MEPIGSSQVPADGAWEVEGAPLRPPLARLLREEGLATYEQVEQALAESKRTGERFGEVLLRWKVLEEHQLALLLARQWQLPFLDEHEVAPNGLALAVLPLEDARRTRAVPVVSKDGHVQVVVAEPTDERLAEVRTRASQEVVFAVVTPRALHRLLGEIERPPAAGTQGTTEAARGTLSEAPERGFDELIALLDAETGHLEALRGRVEKFAAAVAERDQALRQLEKELDAAGTAREHDQASINRLRGAVEERDQLLSLVGAKLDELAATLRAGRAA